MPQKVYVSRERLEARHPVYFSTNGRHGLRLQDAMRADIPSLDNRYSVPLGINNSRITLRILVSPPPTINSKVSSDPVSQWPGYEEWRHENITVQHHTASAAKFKLEELAFTIARHIARFYDVGHRVSFCKSLY